MVIENVYVLSILIVYKDVKAGLVQLLMGTSSYHYSRVGVLFLYSLDLFGAHRFNIVRM